MKAFIHQSLNDEDEDKDETVKSQIPIDIHGVPIYTSVILITFERLCEMTQSNI